MQVTWRRYIHADPGPRTTTRSRCDARQAPSSRSPRSAWGDHHPFDPLAWMPVRSSCRVHLGCSYGVGVPLTKLRAAHLRPPSAPSTPPTAPKPAPPVDHLDLAEVRSATPSTAEALEDRPRRDQVRSGSQILASVARSRRPSFSESLASAAATECATPPRSEPVPLQVHRPIALKGYIYLTSSPAPSARRPPSACPSLPSAASTRRS